MLATFSNLTAAQMDEFRNGIAPDFLPKDSWNPPSVDATTLEPSGPHWQWLQQGLQDAWARHFPLDLSIQLITAIAKHSKLEQALGQLLKKLNQEVASVQPIDLTPEVWPFQRAIMFLAVNSWRARYCPACGKRFVAAKPKSTYCSDACFSESRKESKRAWWSEHGEQWRTKSSKKRKAKEK